MSVGYDNNLFRLSNLNLESNTSSNIIDSDTFDTGYITPKLQIDYQPYIFSSSIKSHPLEVFIVIIFSGELIATSSISIPP